MAFKVREAHWNIFIEYMSAYPEFARGRLNNAQARHTYKKMWTELAEKLNSVGYGQKSIEKWQKTWIDFKQALKKKATEIQKHQQKTGGGPEFKKSLNDFELKILSLLGDSFYKGIGVQELGVDSEDNAVNIQSNKTIPSLPSAPAASILSIFEPTCGPYTFECALTKSKMKSAIPSAFKQSPGCYIPEVATFNPAATIVSEQQENLVTTNIIPKQNTPQTSASCIEETSMTLPIKKEIPFRKRHIDQLVEDHDYLTNRPEAYTKKKNIKLSDEKEIHKVYLDTVEILHNINNNITEGLQKVSDSINEQNVTLVNLSQNVNNLTKEIGGLTSFLKTFLQNKSLP